MLIARRSFVGRLPRRCLHTGKATATGTAAFVDRNDICWPFSLPNPSGEGDWTLSRVAFGSPWIGNSSARRATYFAGLLTDRQASNLLMLDEISEEDKQIALQAADWSQNARTAEQTLNDGSKLWQKNLLTDALFGSAAVRREELVLVGCATLPDNSVEDEKQSNFVSQAVSSYLSLYELESLDLLLLTLNSSDSPSRLNKVMEQLEEEVSSGKIQGYGFRCDRVTLALCETLASAAASAVEKSEKRKSALVALQYPLNPVLENGPEAGVVEFVRERGWMQIAARPLDADVVVKTGTAARQKPVRFIDVHAKHEVEVAEKLHAAFNETLHLESGYDAMLQAVKEEMEAKAREKAEKGQGQALLAELDSDPQVLPQNFDLAVDKRAVSWGHVLLNNRERLSAGGSYEWQVIRRHTIMPQLTAALKLLGQSDSAAAKEWAVLYMVAVGRLLDRFTDLLEVDTANEVKVAASRLDTCAPTLASSPSLRDKALRFVLSAGGDVVLSEDETVTGTKMQGGAGEAGEAGEKGEDRDPSILAFAQQVTENDMLTAAECGRVNSEFEWPGC